MNQFFDMQRWLLLMRKQWGENRKTMLLSIIAIASLQLVWYLLFLLMNSFTPLNEFVQTLTYFFGLFLVGCLYGSSLFAELSTKPKGINYLMLPASNFEKLLCSLVFGAILFFLAYTLIFYIVDIPMVKLANSISASRVATAKITMETGPQKVTNIFLGPSNHGFADLNQCLYFLLIFFALQSAYALGSVYSPKFSFIKTTIILLLLCVFTALLIGQVLNHLMPDGYFYENITTYKLINVPGEVAIRLPGWVHDTVIILFQYSFVPLFWVTAYFKLREKQL
jgi:hypothetical protein